MNIRMLTFAAAAAAVFAGCEKNHEEGFTGDGKAVELEVRLPDVQTKAEGMENENKVKNVQVFVFDHNKMLEAYASGDGSEGSLTVSCSTGQKEVVALVNARPLADVKSLTDLESRKTQLSDNEYDSFVMEGRVKPTLKASSSVEVDVFRIAARVALTEVAVDFELDQHDEQVFQIKSAYLINVAGERNYLNPLKPDKWYNKMKKENDAPAMTGVTVADAYVTVSKPFTDVKYMYCYPNPTVEDVIGGSWSARFTRLVVEAELGGKLYYYPVTLKDGIKSNTSYEVKMKITRPGSSSPDKPVDSMTAGFTVDVQPWDDGVVVDETI